jgi:hypothetical protein
MVGLPLPADRVQRYVGAKWIDDRRDVQSALYFLRRRELGVGDWRRSVRGPKWHAVLSWSDPGPFLHDVLQASGRGVGMLASRFDRRRRRSDTPTPPPAARTDHPEPTVGVGR